MGFAHGYSNSFPSGMVIKCLKETIFKKSKKKLCKMKKYRFVDHPADLAVELEADSMEKLFQSGLEAVIALLTGEEDRAILPDLSKVTIKADGYDDEERLIGLLNEFLYLCQVKNFYPFTVENVSFDNAQVTAVIKGKSRGHGLKLAREIKAATYHDINIKIGKTLKVKIVLDV
jgi:SHS2 domain-containing protein